MEQGCGEENILGGVRGPGRCMEDAWIQANARCEEESMGRVKGWDVSYKDVVPLICK